MRCQKKYRFSITYFYFYEPFEILLIIKHFRMITQRTDSNEIFFLGAKWK